MTRHVHSSAIFSALLAAVVLSGTANAGPKSDMDVRRRNNYEEFKKQRAAEDRKKQREEERAAREEKREKREKERKERRTYGGKTIDEIESEDYHVRTLGQSCIYGADGEVVFRPRGARCKGDPEPEPMPEEEYGLDEEQPQVTRPSDSRAVPASPELQGPARRRIRRGKQPKCIYRNGRVAFQPPGVDCYAPLKRR